MTHTAIRKHHIRGWTVWKMWLLALVAAIAVQACNSTPSGLITSLEDLTSGSQRQGITALNQNRLISVNGLLPHSAPGSVYCYRQTRSLSTAIGLTRTPSFLAEATIAGEDDLERLLAIRNNVFMARNTAAAAVEARLEVVSTRARLVAAEQMAPADPTLVTQVNSELTTASGKYNDARKDFDVALDQAVRAVTHPGVLVIRWQTNDSGSTGGSIGDLLGFGASHDITTSGFAILSGLRVTTLFVGPEVDSLEPGIKRTIDWGWYPWLDVIPWFWRRAYCGVRVTTCVLQAKHILYLQDADILRTSEVNLKASYEQLASLGETLREIDKIEIRSIQQRLDSLSNLGIVGNIERKVYPATLGEAMTAPVIVKDTNWLHEVAEQVTGASERVGTVQDSQGWHTVYVVDVDLSALQRLYDGEGGQEGDPD